MDPLLQPFELGGITLKNRIFTTAHAPNGFMSGDLPGSRYLRYQEEKAAGGIGMVMFGGSSFVAADAHSHFGAFNAGVDEIVPIYRDLAERVHRHGSRAVVQLSHLGRRGDDKASWLPTIGPSPIRERAHRSFPKEMEDFDFDRTIAAYASAARRAKDGGLDGIELQATTGHLADVFLAPRSNHRDDEYGGSLENRARYLFQVVAAMRDAVGPEFLFGIRMAGDEGVKDGIDPDESVELARLLSQDGRLDFFNIIFGSGFDHKELGEQIPSAGSELGGHLPVAHRVRQVVTQPVLHAGRVADLATARYAIREGLVDLIGMTRAHMADPHIVRKLEAGQADRIRPCVGASHCLTGAESLCIHNPATSREEFIPQLITPTADKLRVVVVGGGPAGLEAARVSAERGHRVTLFEAASQLGGQVQAMARTPRQSEKLSITEWLAAEARTAGVEIKLNFYAEAEDVRRLAPDVVIVATGGMPNLELPEGGEHLVLSPSDVLGRTAPDGKTVVIYDDHGGEQALVAAEHLTTGTGTTVEIVTPDAMIGHDVGHTVIPGYKKRLFSAGVTTRPDHVLMSVAKTDGRLSLVYRNALTDERTTASADVVVVEQGTLPLDEVYQELRKGSLNRGQIDLELFSAGKAQPTYADQHSPDSYRLYRVGDAVSHRGVHAAIFDARRLCQNL